MRFIEHMPLSSGALYQPARELTAAAIREALEQAFGPLVPASRDRALVGALPQGIGRCKAQQHFRNYGKIRRPRQSLHGQRRTYGDATQGPHRDEWRSGNH